MIDMKKHIPIFKIRIQVLLLLLLLSLLSCQNDSSKGLIADLDRVVDVSNSKNPLSSLIESYRIIRLESSPECLLGRIIKVIKINSLFFIKTAGAELVLFDKEGNYLRKFGKKGRGPGEYIEVSDFAVNDNGSVVAICSFKDILFYRVDDGSFIKKQSFDYFLNSLFYLPNEELLAQVAQADFLIAHIGKDGNIIKSFGSMSPVLELEQQFEFVKLDDSNFIYRIGITYRKSCFQSIKFWGVKMP
jgi:hypothetical protein